jgi:hypothetical protein
MHASSLSCPSVATQPTSGNRWTVATVRRMARATLACLRTSTRIDALNALLELSATHQASALWLRLGLAAIPTAAVG